MKPTDKPTINPATAPREEFDDGTESFRSLSDSPAGMANCKLLDGQCIPKQFAAEAAGKHEDVQAFESTLWGRKTFTLSLADGTRLILYSGDDTAALVVTFFARAACPGHTVALLAELAQQTSSHYLCGWPLDEIGAFNRQRFENLCALARALPAYLLHVSRHGAFWEEIASAIQ